MDMLQTYQFSSLTGTNTPVGPYRWGIMDMSINGNHRPGGRCIAIYGYNYIIQDVEFYNSPADGCYSEWCLSGLVPVVAGGESMEANFTRVTFYSNGGNGLTFNGPHDTVFTEILTFLNTGRGATFGQTSTYIGSSVIAGLHSYGNQQVGVQFDTGMYATQLQSENNRATGGIYISAPNGQLNGTNVIVFENTGFGISIAGATSTIASMFVYDNSSDGIVISGLNNTLSTISTTSSTGGNGLVLSSGSNGTVINGIIAAQNHFAGIAIGSSDVQINGAFVEFNQQSGVAFSNGMSSVSLSGQLNNNTGDQVAFNTLGNNCIIDLQIFTVSPQVAWAGIVGTNFTRISAIGYDVRSLQSGPAGQTNGPVNVLSYGATGNGTTDDTAAFNAALATGLTVYIPKSSASYLIKGQLNCTTKGQIIYGDGKYQTVITVNSTFNMSALGVFVVSSGEPGPQFWNFYINFTQPITSNRASLIQYPPAFYAQQQPRCLWQGIKINNAMIGIDIRQNSGGSSIVLCELCAYTYHIAMDGSEDSIMVQNCRFEGDQIFTTANYAIYTNASTIGIWTGRSDDLHVDGCLFICGTGLYCFPSIVNPGDGTFGEVSNCDFDSYDGINQNDGGFLSCSACSFTASVNTTQCITQTTGTINLSSAWFFGSVPAVNGLIVATAGAGQGAYINLSTCRFNCTGNMFAIQLNSTGGGDTEINIANTRFDPSVNGLTTEACISIDTGCLITMTGCRFGNIGSSAGQALHIVADGRHNVTGNCFNSWPTALPVGHTALVYANNN